MDQKICKRFWCFFLATVLIVLVLPVPGSAAFAEQDVETEQAAIYEVTALRDETTKHFAMPDGTYRAVSYGEVIHERDEKGQWQEIDNRLHLLDAKGAQLYSNANGRMAFTKSLTLNKPIFSVDDGDYGISMSLAQNSVNTELMAAASSVSEAAVSNSKQRTATTFASLDDAATFDSSSTVTYANALPGVDLEYTVRGHSVKENIIIKSKADSYSYRFALELDGLIARQEKDGGIVICDSNTGKIQYAIPIGYMYDAKEDVSFDVTYTLTKNKETFYLTVVPDASWINDPAREFPITLDPSIVEKTNVKDTYVTDKDPSSEHGNESALWLTQYSSSMGKCNVLLQAPHPTLPTGAVLTDAYFNIWYYYLEHITSGYLNFDVHQVYDYWGENICYTNAQSLDIGPSVYIGMTDASNNTSVVEPAQLTLRIADVARSWYTTNSNCGIMLKYRNGDKQSVILRSSEANTVYKPQLVIEYEIQRLVDGVYTLENGDLGFYAKASGYDNGSLVVQKSVTSGLDISNQFKFTYLETVNGEHYYTIRPMINSALGLYGSTTGGSVSLVSVNASGISAMQKWAVSYSNGYYYIRNSSSSSGKYLAAASLAADDTALVIKSEKDISGRWSLDGCVTTLNEAVFVTATDRVKLGEEFDFRAIPRSYLPEADCTIEYLVTNLDGSETSLANISEVGKLTANDEETGVVLVGAKFAGASQTVWQTVKVYRLEKSVEIKYDHGYSARFTNAVNRIAAQTDVLKNYYYDNFGIIINLTNPTVYQSFADQCNNSGDNGSFYDQFCGHGSETACHNATETPGIDDFDPVEARHHKNMYNVMYELGTKPSSYDARVLFCGHSCCYIDINNGQHKLDNLLYGLAKKEMNVACIADRTNEITHETFTLVHEFGHLLGTSDHYKRDEGGDEDGSYGNNCIYGQAWDDYTTDTDYRICKGCLRDIENYLYGGYGE